MGWAAFENFRSPCFSLGAAVLDSEFRADPESGLRIEQSPAGHIESSGLKISRYQYIENVYLKCMVRITGNLQLASQPAGMMASVFGGAKLTPVLRTPEANPFADTEPMGKYRRSARAGWLYPTTHRAQHCFLQRSFPVMISLLNLYGSVSTIRPICSHVRSHGPR